MKVSKDWLKQLVDLQVPLSEVERLLPLKTIATKELTDLFFELDMKGYNRADLLSMRGVAREVAAITYSSIKFSEKDELIWENSNLEELEVAVENPELVPVYCLAKIEGLKVDQSNPQWIKKLADSGMRSINNIADVTNLVMLEYGQPTHAFDAAKVKNETVKVRLATPGETLQTLDGKERELEETDLVIADEEKALGLAGVMGGKDSEIPDSGEVTILLEAAIFDPIIIRKTTQRLNLPSEASKRFQHGLTKTNLLQALNTAIKMYQELGGKLTAISFTGNLEDKDETVPLKLEKVHSLIGVDIPAKDVENYLEKLGFHLRGANTNSWEVTVPYWRLDINIEEDLIEEVARMYGYEKIPAKELEGELPAKIDQSLFEKIYNTKKTLADLGLTEVQTYSFVSSKILKVMGLNEENQDNIIRVANPISSETEYLREFIWPNLVEVIEKNLKQGFEDIAIFEIGKVYSPVKDELPKESYRLAIALMNNSDNPIEELLVILNEMKNLLRMQVDLEKGGLMKELVHMFHPTRFATVKSGDKVIGGVAETHPRLLNQLGIDKRVAILEITL